MSRECGVLMPCRGRLEHVRAAVESILGQTHADFEFLILDDDSSPDVAAYLAGLSDPRVRLIRHEAALGVSACLQKGLQLLQTDLVFRMDSDDIATPDRLRLQRQHMHAHPETGVLGGQIRLLDSSAAPPRVPLRHAEIGYRLNWSNALNHPTVVFRRVLVEAAGGYDSSLECAQDYELWMRLFFMTRIENLPEVLLHYRVHPAQNSATRRASSTAARARMRQAYRHRLTGCEVSPCFDEQDAWTPEHRPDAPAWQAWQDYLLRLREIFRSGTHAAASDPGRDLARRLWRSAKAYRAAGGDPARYEQVLKKLNRWQAALKGVF